MQNVLSYDGKNVSQGFRGVNFGDIDLWGFEEPPSLKDHEQRLKYNLEFIDDVTRELNVDNRSAILENLCGLLGIIACALKTYNSILIWKREIMPNEKNLSKNPDFANKYSLSMPQGKENELLCKSLLCRAIAVNRDICLCCSTLNGSVQNASSSYHEHLENQSNFWSLLSQ